MKNRYLVKVLQTIWHPFRRLQDTFLNFPSLEFLFLRYNFLTQIPQLSYSGKLRGLYFQGFENPPDFQIFEGAFTDMSNLEELSLVSLSLGHLNFEKFKGLANLTILNLEKSNLKSLEPEWLRAVPRLKYFKMAHCTGLDKVPVDALIGYFYELTKQETVQSFFIFLNGPTPASFLFIFVLFNNNFTEKL